MGCQLLKKAEVYKSLTVSGAEAECIEKETESVQSGMDNQWQVDFSCFHNILVRKRQSNPSVLVQRLLSMKDISIIPAIKREARKYDLISCPDHAF